MKATAAIRKVMNSAIMGLCIALFAAMVVVGTYQICTRYFFGKPSTISEELLTYLFTWMALLASAYVFGKRDHMRMGFIADKIKGKAKKILDIVLELVVLAFSALAMVWGGWSIMMLSMHQKTASLGIPMGYVYIVLPLSGVCIVIYCILNIIDMCHGKDLAMADGIIEIDDFSDVKMEGEGKQ